jgi:hypothetical protein
VRELQRGARIDPLERALDGRRGRRQTRDQLAQLTLELAKTQGECAVGGDLDDAGVDQDRALKGPAEQTPAGAIGAGIDP